VKKSSTKVTYDYILIKKKEKKKTRLMEKGGEKRTWQENPAVKVSMRKSW
jgi:hypothetical protein